MIRYALACDRAHEFESWFPSGSAFDDQRARGLVTCPACGSSRVEKQVMAPALGRVAGPVEAMPAAALGTETPQPVAMLSDREREMRAMLRAMREHVTRTAENFGRGFAEEARRMHHGEIEHRSIYGEATGEEARALRDEGIEVHPLPVLADERN